MSIQAFSFPLPETRFFQAGQHVYKFRIRRGERTSPCEEDMLDEALVSEELETSVRAVLANLDGLHPFTTQHFNIFPYTSKWERVSKLTFMKGGVKLSAYPFLITLYVECREPAGPYADGTPLTKATSVWNPPETESVQNCSPCSSDSMKKVQTTVVAHPEEGAVSQGNQKKRTSENVHFLQKSPCWADGAEAMVCGSEIHADSECDAAPETSDPSLKTGQNTWSITKLASSLFPFSMFFPKSSAK